MATEQDTQALSLSAHDPADDVTPTEQELLDEYERLADNMKKVRLP